MRESRASSEISSGSGTYTRMWTWFVMTHHARSLTPEKAALRFMMSMNLSRSSALRKNARWAIRLIR